jgi:hypothetical protein
MARTLREVMEYLKQVDEITLMERLSITSEDLVERFIDKIEDDFEKYEEEMESETEEEE